MIELWPSVLSDTINYLVPASLYQLLISFITSQLTFLDAMLREDRLMKHLKQLLASVTRLFAADGSKLGELTVLHRVLRTNGHGMKSED
jgi:hypothetical protein